MLSLAVRLDLATQYPATEAVEPMGRGVLIGRVRGDDGEIVAPLALIPNESGDSGLCGARPRHIVIAKRVAPKQYRICSLSGFWIASLRSQ